MKTPAGFLIVEAGRLKMEAGRFMAVGFLRTVLIDLVVGILVSQGDQED